MDTFELDITGIAYGGSGVGRHEGRAIFVPYAIPGEVIRARIVQDKKRFAIAENLGVISPAPSRVIPRCIHFGVCGGCHWQHMDYPAQLEMKRQIVADQMARIGGFRELTVFPTLASPDPWYYRSHVTFRTTREGELGFVTIDDRTVLGIQECHIIRPELFAMKIGAEPMQERGRVRLQVGSDPSEQSSALISGEEEGLIQTLSEHEVVHYTLNGKTFQVSAGSFFQVNLAQAETLVNLVLDRLNLRGDEHVLDLYSGVGLFTAFLVDAAQQVTAMEVYPAAVADAEVNLAGVKNVTFVQGAIENVLHLLKERIDAVVVDPPRAGMKPEALDALIRLKPTQIVYVSCDPSTLARDAKRLVESGYTLHQVQPVDMFPQTFHIESVGYFTYGAGVYKKTKKGERREN